MNKPKQQKQKPKTAAKKKRDPRVFITGSPLSIAKSIAARFGEEICEEEFFDEPELEVKSSSILAIP